MRGPALLIVLISAAPLALAPSAQAKTVFVAGNGLDGAACGAKAAPCRSITNALASAAPGDTILVGPGKYGDLNSDGALDDPGDETGALGCDCVLAVNKQVTLLSSAGAAATVIAAEQVDVGKNVLLIADGGEFGRPGKGFTVTSTATGGGIVIDSTDVAVRGNQVLASRLSIAFGSFSARGIETVDAAQTILIEANQVSGWRNGIFVLGGGKTVRGNQVSRSGLAGIHIDGPSIAVGNVVTDTLGFGISLAEAASAIGNTSYGNGAGIVVVTGFSGVIERNNVFSSNLCGLSNDGVPGLVAANNYWGAATGPGADPADVAGPGCDIAGGTTTVTPFAAKPFKVKARIKP